METDVPILMGGLLDLTSLLPLVPVAIASFLQEIFEVFLRMAAFNLRKPGELADFEIESPPSADSMK